MILDVRKSCNHIYSIWSTILHFLSPLWLFENPRLFFAATLIHQPLDIEIYWRKSFFWRLVFYLIICWIEQMEIVKSLHFNKFSISNNTLDLYSANSISTSYKIGLIFYVNLLHFRICKIVWCEKNTSSSTKLIVLHTY